MIFYLVAGTSAAPACLVGTQAEARALSRERGTPWEQEDVPTDKAGLMAYINELRQGDILTETEMRREREWTRDEIVNSNTPEAQVKARELMTPTSPSIELDEQFEKLSIHRQLHFAAIAMENARAVLP